MGTKSPVYRKFFRILDYDAFLQFMKGKGLHIPYRNNPLFRKEIYVIEPATTLIYTARKDGPKRFGFMGGDRNSFRIWRQRGRKNTRFASKKY